ncbi:transcription initiation factor TFIID subunit 8-like [Argentina anserina]|uniref:transcription initiation factor TFIID subunit 8-like n=1 Tax=Argentina anserina TaxID=57926 RepID=UPI00217668A6|nr:transcription initiation factor TFIID subunit 8-like [Potentilla anserina]
MSDGGGESGREHQQSSRIALRKPGGGDDFARAISKIAVAQVCEIVGFQSFQLSALETLSDVAVQYICNIGKAAHLYANLSGRTDCNVFDIIRGLEDLSGAQGFAGASDIHHCLASSGTIKEISQYVAEAEHVPFAYSLPCFPVIKDRKLTPSFWQRGEETPGAHIPPWLPAFPEPHTYTQPTMCDERATEPDSAFELEKQQRNVERTILNFQHRLVCNGMVGPSVDPGDDEKVKQARESNPFLAVPLQFGETEVAQVTLPSKMSVKAMEEVLNAEKHAKDKCSSLLETFAPAIEAIKNKSFELEEDQKIFSTRESTLQFKIGMSKKSLGVFQSGPHKKGFGEVYPWFGRENEKDEKKKRAEKILKNSMENSQELAQL